TIKKNGAVVAGPTVGNSLTFTATAPASGVTDTYSGHVSDSSSGSTASTTCVCDNSTTLTGTPIPTCTITPPASLCPGSTRDITVTGSGRSEERRVGKEKKGAVVAGPTVGNSRTFTASAPASAVTDTYSGHVSDSSSGSTAGTTCVCDNSTTLTGTPIPTCTITPPASLCPGSTRDITVTGSG